MSILPYLTQTCEIQSRSISWKNEYWESIHTYVVIIENCFSDYPKYGLDQDNIRESVGDVLLFVDNISKIKVNDIVTNIKNIDGIIVDNERYLVKQIAKLCDDEWIHHLECDLFVEFEDA